MSHNPSDTEESDTPLPSVSAAQMGRPTSSKI